MRPAPVLLLLIVCSVALLGADSCAPGSAGSGADSAVGAGADETPAARLDQSIITIGEVDEWIRHELFRQASEDGDEAKLHELRSQAVENILNERLVEREAQKRGVGTDELMEAEATRRMSVTDAEVLEFWERNKGSMGEVDFTTAAAQIRRHLERAKGPEAARGFVRELRADADVEVLIEVPRIEVAAAGPAQGPEDAPITIVEFSDYQCPFCRRAEPVIEEVLKRYEGKVRFVYRQFPLDRIHPQARGASEAALCAHDQGRFWDYHERLFVEGADLAPEALESHAEALELDLAAFRSCVQERRHQAQVEADVSEGRAAGVTGTPAFFVNGIVLKGAQPVDEFVRVIDAELDVAVSDEG